MPFCCSKISKNLLQHLQVSMNEMMESILNFDDKKMPIRHIPGPEGVRGRNSDNELILEKLGSEPTIKLNDGLQLTYDWIKTQLAQVGKSFGRGFVLYSASYALEEGNGINLSWHLGSVLL